MRILGLMSGTSADGIDAALIDLEGAPPTLSLKVIQHLTVEYAPELRAQVFAAFRPETSSADRLCRLHADLGEAYAFAAQALLDAAGIDAEQVDLLALHGQTIWYEPPTEARPGSVLTLGEPAIVAEWTGITTVSGVRARDLAAGGRGAPLVAYLDWLLFRSDQARGLLNLGGIGNLTALPAHNSHVPPLAFDTGPGNMLIDYCVERLTDGAQQYDDRGQLAAHGTIADGLLAELMAHPYLQQVPPKSTGRELFGTQFGADLWWRGEALGLPPLDILATATAFTAESIAYAVAHLLPFPIAELYIAGGGARNGTLMQLIAARLPEVAVNPHDSLGLPAAVKECALMALIAYETWHGRVGALPVFTGARHATVLGALTPGRQWPPPHPLSPLDSDPVAREEIR